MSPDEGTMSPRRSNQVMISLSKKAMEDYTLIAQWKVQPLGAVLREILEQHHLSPSFGSALKRAKQELMLQDDDEPDTDEGEDEE